MKVKYIGESFGVEGLTNGKIYEVIAIEDGMLRIIDDSGEDYLYSASKPCSLEDNTKCGKWERVEDKTEKEEYIKKMIKEYGFTVEQAEEMYKSLIEVIGLGIENVSIKDL